MTSGLSTKTALLTILLSGAVGMQASAQVAVIAHKSAPQDTLKKSELRDFYTGDIKSWSNGERVVVFDLKPKTESKTAFYKFLGRSATRMKSIWMKKMLSGEGKPPPAMKDELEMLRRVRETPGAVGFVPHDQITDDVKVLILLGGENPS